MATSQSTGVPVRRRLTAAVIVALVLASMVAVAPATEAADLPTTVQNLQHTGNSLRGPRAGHDLMVFLASEGDEQRDLNGDGVIGTTNTNAYQVWDSTTGQIHSLMGMQTEWIADGVLQPAVRFGEGLVAYSIDETVGALDLNGDGDSNDDIMHVWTRSGGVINLGFDVWNSNNHNVRVGGGKVVFTANENELHPELIPGSQDLNGDGDATDYGVVLAWDIATGAISQIGSFFSFPQQIHEDDGLFLYRPGGLTATLGVYDAADGSYAACCVGGLHFDSGGPFDIRDGFVGFGARFASSPTPITFGWWDVAAGTWENSGVAMAIGAQGVAPLENGWMAFEADETTGGTDLNGDGDQLDVVLHLWDPVAEVAINSGLAVDQTYKIVAGDTAVAFVVDEDEQGADVNGDGDISTDDRIVHVWPITDALPTNTQLGLTQLDLAADGDLFAFSATQATTGATLERRVYTWTPTGGLADLGVNAVHGGGSFTRSGIRASDGQIGFLADELATGSDLDGDTVISDGSSDGVPTVWDPVNGFWYAPDPGRVLPDSGGIGNGFAFTRSHAMFLVREKPPTGPGADLNCDGDTVDDIVHVAALAATPAPTPCTYPVITPGAQVVAEGDSGSFVVDVPVTMSATSSNPVTIDWTTLDTGALGIATADVDYVAASGTVTFAPGETAQTVPITVFGDTTDEPPAVFGEWALISFSNPSAGATLDLGFYGLGIISIIDDDPPPTITPGLVTVPEGDTGSVIANVPVTLSNPSASSVTVDWTTLDTGAPGIATADVDYVAASGTVTFAPGETTQTVPITVIGDMIDEPPALFGEWALISFSNPSPNASLDLGFFGLGVASIIDDDP